jgi:Protein of unknown function (DUF4239)
MSTEALALTVAGVVFVGGLFGLILQHSLPEKFTTGGTKDMIMAVAGLLTLLSALVLGLLIWTAYGVYSGQNLAVQTLAAKDMQLDLALTDYGPDASAGRAILRQDLAKTVKETWSADYNDADFAARNFAAAIESLRRREQYLKSLTPSTDAQTQALAAAMQTVEAIGQSRLQMSFALESAISYPLMFTVIAWGTVLFCGFGLTSRASPMSILVLAVGALAVASAVYLILDLSSPYSGLFRASPAPLEQVLAYIGQGQGTVGGQR